MKQKIGAVAFIVGLIGTGFGAGGVENSITNMDLIASVGVAFTSLMLMYMGTLLIKEQI